MKKFENFRSVGGLLGEDMSGHLDRLARPCELLSFPA